MWRPGLFITLCTLALVGCSETRDGAPVEAAVVNGYRGYAHHRAIAADCDHADDNADGSEWWWCGLEVDAPALDGRDTCTVDIRRRATGAVTVIRFVYCLSDDGL